MVTQISKCDKGDATGSITETEKPMHHSLNRNDDIKKISYLIIVTFSLQHHALRGFLLIIN